MGNKLPTLDTQLVSSTTAATPTVREMVRGDSGDPTKALFGDGSFKVPSGGGGGGLTLISSGKITTPVEYFDVALPGVNSPLYFVFNDVRFTSDNADILSCAFSPDGGSSFWCDPAHFDTYDITHNYMTSDGVVHVSSFQNSLAYFGATIGHRYDGCTTLFLSDDDGPRIFEDAYSSNPQNGTGVQTFVGNVVLFPEATTPPTFVRPNLMRVLPYGSGDCDPPTSGENMVSGSWALFGVPDPS